MNMDTRERLRILVEEFGMTITDAQLALRDFRPGKKARPVSPQCFKSGSTADTKFDAFWFWPALSRLNWPVHPMGKRRPMTDREYRVFRKLNPDMQANREAVKAKLGIDRRVNICEALKGMPLGYLCDRLNRIARDLGWLEEDVP